MIADVGIFIFRDKGSVNAFGFGERIDQSIRGNELLRFTQAGFQEIGGRIIIRTGDEKNFVGRFFQQSVQLHGIIPVIVKILMNVAGDITADVVIEKEKGKK